MEAKHIEELRKNFRFIVNNVGDAEALCDELVALGVFDENYVDKILLKQPAPKEQTKELLYLLKFKGPQAYGKFIAALESSGNKHVVEKLMKPDIRPEPVHLPIQPPDAPPCQAPPPQALPPQGPSSQTQSIQVQPTSVQPSGSEEAFDNWPLMTCKERKCLEQEKMQLLSDEMVYKITEFPEKGFVLRLKCRPHSYKDISHYFDNCNTHLSSVMKFLDTEIQPGKCTTHLNNKTASELETNIRDIIQANTQKLENAGYFMMFFLSFGTPEAGCGQVFDTKKECVNVHNMIQTVKDCVALKDKPKIFIVITITEENNSTEPTEDRTVADAGMDNSSTNEDDLFVLHVNHGQQGPWIQCQQQMWFTKAFCDVLQSHSYNLHFLELIEKVNKLMSNAIVNKENKTRGHVGEVKVVQKDTRKKLYFLPGITGARQATS
ncbi:uncharacterized protein LOC117336099 [Pecten maximus]|uniref:uncharacterized protein LOC117336099 n=1 Tax=Pecten maximus TaxID=6579 RepID=UPI001458FB86|nr:uncharacterized protein LOC117336099 [Pecten maximus]